MATGKAHVEAARLSALSVRETNPDLQIAIFCDSEPEGDVFDIVRPVADPHARSKVDYLPSTPFEKTLYLDGDTRVVADISEMFRLLEQFDIAMSQVVRWHKSGYQRNWREEVPSCFPQYNSGVFLYHSGPEVRKFLNTWREGYHSAGFKEDQVTLRELLWKTDLKVATLPPQYNMRKYNIADRFLSQKASPRVLHLPKYNPKKQKK